MNSTHKAEQIKVVIMNELFIDYNNQLCILDLILKNDNRVQQNVQALSKESKEFVSQERSELLTECNGGQILFFRKYNYEKILNDYLGRKFNIKDIDFTMFPSEQKRKEMEEKRQQEAIAKRQSECEKQILKEFPTLKWERTVKVGHILYIAKRKNGQTIEIRYLSGKLAKKNGIENRIIYAGKPFQYIQYDIKEIVDIIENTHPKHIKNKQIIYVSRIENSVKPQKKNDIEKPKENVVKDPKENKKKKSNKKKSQKQSADDYHIYFDNLAKRSKVPLQFVMDCAQYFGRKCHQSKKGSHCPFYNKTCNPLYFSCIYYSDFLKKIDDESKKIRESYIALENQYDLSKEYIESTIQTFQSKCSYCKQGICSILGTKSAICTVQNEGCFYHTDFINALKRRQNEKLGIQPSINKDVGDYHKIWIKDFVVRSNVFKCAHNHHSIKDIVAVIYTDNDGRKQENVISAGFCPQCNIYFILESTYESLKRKGIILCRISDEKNYLKSGSQGGMQLAQQSLLMQFGYSVAQQEGLSSMARQRILAVIIDNKIMSKSEVISYLDFFISQRSSRSNMGIAISKWEEDREFVENYKIGLYTQYGVKAIFRK